MESWIDALRPSCGPLTDAASIFSAQLGVERDPPRGVAGLVALAKTIAMRSRPDSMEPEDERLFVELAGAYLALLLCDVLKPAAHAHRNGEHRLRFGRRGFFDPFVAIERALGTRNAHKALAYEVALAEAEARERGPIARTALEAERQLSALEITVRDQFDTRLWLETKDGETLELDIARVARASGLASDQALRSAVARLLSLLPRASASAESFADIEHRILPRPVGPQLLSGLDPSSALFSMPLVGSAKLCFVLRYEGRARYVRARELEQWRIEPSQLRRIAIRNLASQSARAKISRVEDPRGAFVVASTGDGLDAARVLLPGLSRLLSDELGAPFALGMPHRDTLLACPLDDGATFGRMEARARDLAARAPHAILGELVRVDRDGNLSLLSV